MLFYLKDYEHSSDDSQEKRDSVLNMVMDLVFISRLLFNFPFCSVSHPLKLSRCKMLTLFSISSFHAIVPFLYPLKTSGSDVFKGYRSNHWRCSVKKHVLQNFANYTGKHLCWSLILIELQALKSAVLLKRDSNIGAFL